ncbi:hypothetical protein J437_LFUL002298 [Ladona fulva]|uniref:Histone deacetylase complex subunit SAP130 C-terminal domain-containing protein n=1 Tax=Ladona fulva TaxID=123851 RepID=A0A8K0JWX0_LADFU|nr:hypothetical protein J437_LFUL002298 [Ladona fulva]
MEKYRRNVGNSVMCDFACRRRGEPDRVIYIHVIALNLTDRQAEKKDIDYIKPTWHNRLLKHQTVKHLQPPEESDLLMNSKYTAGGAHLRPVSSTSPSATLLPRITSPPASSVSTTTVSTPATANTTVVASGGAMTWVTSKASTATPVGNVIVQQLGHHPRGPYSQLRSGVTAKMPLQSHRLQVEAAPVRTTTSTAATSTSHAASISSSSSSSPSSGLHIPEKSYFKHGGASSTGAVTIAQVLSSRVGTVSGLSSASPSIASSTGSTAAFPIQLAPVSSPMPGRSSSGSGPSSISTTSSTTTAPGALHGMVSTTRIALAGPRAHQQLVGPKQHPVSSSSAAPTSTSASAPTQAPPHLPLQPIQTQQATIHPVVPLSTVHQQQPSHPVQQHQAHQGTAIAITTVVTRALTYTGAVVSGPTLGRSATMLSVPAIPSPSSSIPSTTTTTPPTHSSTPPITPVTSTNTGVQVGKVFTSPISTLSLGRVGLEVTSADDHSVHQPLVSLQQGQHQNSPGVYIHASHPRASPAPQITTVPRGERSQVLVGGNSTIVQQQQLTTSPSPPSTLSSTVPSSTISSTSSTLAVVSTTNSATTYALPTTAYYYGGSAYTVGVARPFSGSGPGAAASGVTALPANAGSSFVPIQAVSAAVNPSTSVVASNSTSVVTVAPASPASLTTIRPVGQPALTTHQVHGPVRFNPVMVVDSTRSAAGGPPFLSEGQFVEVAGAGNGIVGTHFASSALQPKHPVTTLAPPPVPSSTSIVSVQASPIKPNSSPRPSILRKRDCDGMPMKAQKNLLPSLTALSSSVGASAPTATSSTTPLGTSHSPPPSPSLGTGNHHSSSSPTSSSSSSSSSSSAGSTTISATSSPGGEVDVGEDSLPHQLLAPPVPGSSSVTVKSEPMDDSHPSDVSSGTQARPFLCAPQTTQVVVEMSPRKKPRKQQLTGNELQEPKFSEDEMEFISESKVRKEVKNASTSVPVPSSAPVAISAPPPVVAKRPTSMSLLNGYRYAWKSRHNHFIRPGDVRPREERRPSIADIAAQRRVLQKLNGWKVHHLSSQMEELAELEIQVFEKLSEMLGLMERKQTIGGKDIEKDMNRINELLKGNLQRSKVIKDQMHEAKSQVMKIFDHKDIVSEILSKSASKRSAKKREKS